MQSRRTDERGPSLPSAAILTASAGAGKTYALTHQYAQILLSAAAPHNSLQNVLAITFTNNAAAEMKQRILALLKLAAFGDDGTLSELSDRLSMEQADIQSRALRLVDDILDNFSDFQVKTVDSFMSTVFKASSLEYGYHPEFEILLGTDRIFDLAFGLFSREVRENSAEAEVVWKIVGLIAENRKAENGFAWNPYAEIAGQVKKIYKAVSAHAKPLGAVHSADSSSFLREEITASAGRVGMLISNSGLNISKLFADDLALIADGNIHALIERKLRATPVTKPKGKDEKASYERWIGEIEREHQELNGLLRRFILVYAEQYYRPVRRGVRPSAADNRKIEEAARSDLHR